MHEPAFINIHSHHKPLGINETVIRNGYLTLPQNLPANYRLSVGIHPWFVHKYQWVQTEITLRKLLAEPTVMAIGEIGLDKLRPNLPLQLQFFENQLNLATAFNKPVIIHCVKALSELLPYFKNTSLPFILHGYQGNVVQTNQLLALGNVYFSFGPQQIFHTQKIKETLALIDPTKIFIETDTNRMPVEQVYNSILPYTGMPADQFKRQVYENYKRVFEPKNI